jgi:hypothetical protein
MKTILLAATAAFALMSGTAAATTWGESKVIDPVSGRSVKVQEPVSWGSYIYSWPGKEDQVFWPATDDNWLWFNPKSGYGAFGDDFAKLKDPQLTRVRTWLAANYDREHPPRTRLEKLAWLERIYGQRDMGAEFWCFFNRLMAFEYSTTEPTRSLEYVRKTLPQLESRLLAATDGSRRLVTLYLLGEYHRRLGDAVKSRDYFDQARAATYKDEDGKEHVGSDYINEIIKEREALGSAPLTGEAEVR